MQINRSRLLEKFGGEEKYFDDEVKNRDINFIVFHHTKSSSVPQAISLYKEHGVSPHYLIDPLGQVFLLVEEENIAFHAGCSFWRGVESINNSSIGIEFLSNDPYEVGFSNNQINSGLFLCRNLVEKYNIEPPNIVGHSDIAFFKDSKLLGRKDDPSHLFKWQFLAKNGIGIFAKIELENDRALFKINNSHPAIAKAKKNLHRFGYLVNNFDENFDEEMRFLARVFNQRFNPGKFQENSDYWYLSSELLLREIIKQISV